MSTRSASAHPIIRYGGVGEISVSHGCSHLSDAPPQGGSQMHLPLHARRDAHAEGMPSQAPPEDGEKTTWGRPARIVGFVAVTATLAAVWVGVARSGGGIEASGADGTVATHCLLYTSPSPRDGLLSRMPSSA